jgi:hypothetical protein
MVTTRIGILIAIAFLVTSQMARAQQHVPCAGTLRVKVLERSINPVLAADRPWESFCVNTCTVLREGNKWHMWYESYDSTYKSDNDALFCYATSNDGVHWTKPNLGLVEYAGNKNNNILLVGSTLGGLSGESVFVDSQASPAEKYKMVFVTMLRSPPKLDFTDHATDWQLRGAVSPDGINWRMLDKPLLVRMSDTQNVCLHDDGVYRLYVRMWRTDGRGEGDRRRRVIGYTESKTFGEFPMPSEIFKADDDDPPSMDFYNSAATRLAPGLFMMFPRRFRARNGPRLAACRRQPRWAEVRTAGAQTAATLGQRVRQQGHLRLARRDARRPAGNLLDLLPRQRLQAWPVTSETGEVRRRYRPGPDPSRGLPAARGNDSEIAWSRPTLFF